VAVFQGIKVGLDIVFLFVHRTVYSCAFFASSCSSKSLKSLGGVELALAPGGGVFVTGARAGTEWRGRGNQAGRFQQGYGSFTATHTQGGFLGDGFMAQADKAISLRGETHPAILAIQVLQDNAQNGQTGLPAFSPGLPSRASEHGAVLRLMEPSGRQLGGETQALRPATLPELVRAYPRPPGVMPAPIPLAGIESGQLHGRALIAGRQDRKRPGATTVLPCSADNFKAGVSLI